MKNSLTNCPLCGLSSETQYKEPATLYICKNCGLFKTYSDFYIGGTDGRKKDKAILSHYVNRMQRGTYHVALTREIYEKVLQTQSLPSPIEQMDNLILWLGDELDAPGSKIIKENENLSAIIGALNSDNVKWVIKEAIGKDLIRINNIEQSPYEIELSFKGWNHYDSIKRKEPQSKIAFMAMEFGKEELENVVDKCFKPAVDKTGYKLKCLLDEQPAGLIDDRLRVEIRMSRFLIADLTHENRGAYWEAGFAEGLGMPVIYTCKKEEFDKNNSHFDTNHHLTILWDSNNLEKAANDLINTIRATLPNEAIMTDD